MFFGACAAHDFSPMHRIVLAPGRGRHRVGQEFAGVEGRRVEEVCIEGRDERRSLLDNSDAGMGVSMDAALVPFGISEPAFEVEVVVGDLRIVRAGEESRCEAFHHAGHEQSVRMGVTAKLVYQSVELRVALGRRARLGVQDRIDLPDIGNAFAHLVLQVFYFVEAAVDTRGEACAAGLLRPFFFVCSVRSREARTSRRASVILSPGGSSGPPSVPFRMPRTAVQ
jgi:hypothetical protein